jgi:hypothetical protein
MARQRKRHASLDSMRVRQIKALQAAGGSWKDADHPELKDGAAKWVKTLRGDGMTVPLHRKGQKLD